MFYDYTMLENQSPLLAATNTPSNPDTLRDMPSLELQFAELHELLAPVKAKGDDLTKLNQQSSDFWTQRLTAEQLEDEGKMTALGHILFGSAEVVSQYCSLHPDLALLLDEYKQTGIPETRNAVETGLVQQRLQIIENVESRYNALRDRFIRSFDYEEFMSRCVTDDTNHNYYLGNLTNSILFQMDMLDTTFTAANEVERCEFLEYKFQQGQGLFERLKKEFPDLMLEKPKPLPDKATVDAAYDFYEIAQTMDDDKENSEYSQYNVLYRTFKLDSDFHPPADDRPNSLIWSINRTTPSDRERITRNPNALVAINKEVLKEHQRLAELGVLKQNSEHHPPPETLFVNTKSPVVVTGLEESEGHVLLITEDDIPAILRSFYIDPDSEDGRNITYERIARIIPGHFIDGIDEVVFLGPEGNNDAPELTSRAEVREIAADYSNEDLELEREVYLTEARKTLTHEIFEHAKFKFTLDELQGFVDAVNTDNQRRTDSSAPLNITPYIIFLRANSDFYGEARIAREDLCETAKQYVNAPANLYHIAPTRYNFMLNLFTSYLPENWKAEYREAQKREIEFSKIMQKTFRVDDNSLTEQILKHERTPREELLIPRDNNGKIAGPNTYFSTTGEYIITDGTGRFPKGKIIIHRPPHLRVASAPAT